MTCLECSNSLSQGISTCTFCGAPVESVVEESSGAAQVGTSVSAILKKALPESEVTNTAELKLWSPLVIALLFIPVLGMWVSTIMLALNWKALGKKNWQTWTWLFFVVPFALLTVLPDGISVFKSMLVNFIVWLPLVAIPQIWYLRSYFATGYKQKGWIIPVGLGLIVSFAVPKAAQMFEDWQDPDPVSASTIVSNSPLQTQPTQSLSFEDIAREKAQFVVPVEVSYMESSYVLLTKDRRSTGSAVLIAVVENAIIFLTNRHVVETPAKASQIKRHLVIDGSPTSFEILALGDPGIDLAILKVTPAQPLQQRALYSARLDQVAVGEECVAIGNTLGRGISVTTGVVSMIENMGAYKGIRTSAPISAGNSGGALFRRRDGALLGITTGSVDTHHAQNVNLVIPMDCVDKIQLLNTNSQ